MEGDGESVQSAGERRDIPVTIITGYLGAGKTTLLNELLRQRGAEGLALIVNDMGSVNIDAELIRKNRALTEAAEMVELQNGCICCTLQDAFMEQLARLAAEERVQRIVVEASGISNPASIAEGFLSYQKLRGSAGFYLDSIVAVADADRIYAEFLEELRDASENGTAETEDDPDIINLVMDQIEFCNVVVLNKCDLLLRKQLDEVKDIIRSFQREAEIIECTRGQIQAERIFHGARFDYDAVLDSSLVQRALTHERQHDGCVDEYGISSFVYEEPRPFDYDKFMRFMEEYPEELIRAKGYIWFADDDIHVQLFEQAGRNASVSEVSNWVASFSPEEQEEVFRSYPDVQKSWDSRYGDRMNQIVFIGKGAKREDIITALNACLAE